MEPLQRENLGKQSQVGLLIWLSGLLLWVSGWLIWLYGWLFCSPCLLIWSSGLLTRASARTNTPAETICLHSSRCSHPTSRPHIVALADTARIFKPRRIASNKMFEPKRISNIFAFATTTCLISRSLSPTRQHKASLDLYLQFRYTGKIRCDAENTSYASLRVEYHRPHHACALREHTRGRASARTIANARSGHTIETPPLRDNALEPLPRDARQSFLCRHCAEAEM